MKSAEDIIDQIRESRKQLSAECGHDPARFVDYLKQVEERYRGRTRRFRKSRARAAAVPAK